MMAKQILSLIGASLAYPKKLYFGIFGDLAFFYNMNVLGNRHVGRNLRILLINNGRGTEFRNYDHPGARFGEDADEFIAAAGHYGKQSRDLVRHYAEDLGFKYLSAKNKDEFQQSVKTYLNPQIGDKPVIFEVFTDSNDESNALEIISNVCKHEPTKEELRRKKIRDGIVSIIGEQGLKIGKYIGKTLKSLR